MNSVVGSALWLLCLLAGCSESSSPDSDDLGKVGQVHPSDAAAGIAPEDAKADSSASDPIDSGGDTGARDASGVASDGSSPEAHPDTTQPRLDAGDQPDARATDAEAGAAQVVDLNAPIAADPQGRCPDFLGQLAAGVEPVVAANAFVDLPPGSLEATFTPLFGIDVAPLFAQGLSEVCTVGDPSIDEILGMDLQDRIGEALTQPPISCGDPEMTPHASATELAQQLSVPTAAIEWLIAQPGYDLEALTRQLQTYPLPAPFPFAALVMLVADYATKPSESPFFGLPGVERVYRRGGDDHIQIRLPFDHADPSGDTFITEVRLSRPLLPSLALPADPTAANVATLLTLEGLGSQASYDSESFSHNFLKMTTRFGVSDTIGWKMPFTDQGKWELLNEEQNAADVHQVIEVLKPVLKGPWVIQAVDRGATTALVHRSLYPDDVVGTILYDPYLGNEGKPNRGWEFLDEPDANGCRQQVRAQQRALLQNLAAIVTNPDASFCFGYYDPELLVWVAQNFEWYFWSRITPYGGQSCADLHGEAAPLAELERSLVDAIGRATPWYDWRELRYQDLREWNIDTQLRSELAPLVEQARADLGLSPAFEGPWGPSVEYDPTLLDEARERITNDGPSIVAIYHDYVPLTAWKLDLSGSPNSIGATLTSDPPQLWIEDLDRKTVDAIRALMVTWVGEEAILPEAFDGR